MISVIMGVYNGESTLVEAVNSIINQTYSDWEFIICDDCSTDKSLSILESFSDPRIVIIKNKENLGLAASLNHCLKYARGEYIARMDCDDVSEPNRFERQLSFLINNAEYDLVGTYMQAFENGEMKEIIKNKANPTKYDLPKGAPFAHATVMVKAEVMHALNGYKISEHTIRTEDVDLWYRFFAAGFKGTTIPEVLYLVRVDDAAYKRRKLKYMLHASYIIWYGCGLVSLPWYYRAYSVKPILSWMIPSGLKVEFRKLWIK